MELRGVSQLHYIQTVKDGSLVKTQNVFRGRPVLRFKKVEDIYACEDAKNQDSSPKIHPKSEFEDLQFEYDRFEVKTPFLPLADRTLKDDVSELDCHGSDIELNNDDDFDFCTATLKEIKNRCKAKKRKRSKNVAASEETINSSYSSKAHQFEFQPTHDDYDFDEPLSKWKAKLKSNAKAKKKQKIKNFSALTLSALVTSEWILDEETLPLSVIDLPGAVAIKAEPLETDYSTCEDVISSNLSLSLSEDRSFHSLLINNIVNTGNRCAIQAGPSIHSPEVSHCYALTQVPHDYMHDSGSISPDDSEEGTAKMEEASGSEWGNEECFNNPLSCDESLQTVPSVANVNTVSRVEVKKSDTTTCCSLRCTNPCCDSVNCRSCHGDRKGFSSNPMKKCSLLSEDVTRAFDNGIKDDLPLDSEVCALSSHLKVRFLVNQEVSGVPSQCVAEESCVVSVTENPDPIKDREPVVTVCAASRKNRVETHHIDATIELTTPGNNENGHQLKLQQSPKRLFSTRKVISPPSQKRLQKILECIELEDNEDYKCREKSNLVKHTEKKISRAERHHQNEASEVIASQRQMLQKQKNFRKSVNPKGPIDVYQIPHGPPRISTLCNSVESCSQSAIAFSQQQMRDIDRLAVKLLDELKSMRDIVEDRFQSDPHGAVHFKEEKVEKAIKSATKVEETTRKWLSIMARDCNRFCKIMGHIEKDSAAGGSATNRKRKIMFADEVGGELCHVKLFEVERSCAQTPPETI